MADFTILDFSEITDPVGLKLYIVSDIADFHITYENLFTAFTEYTDQAESTVLDESKSASYTKTLAANTKLISVDIRHVTGTPVVKIGTSVGTDDVMKSRTIVNTRDSNNELNKTFIAGQILYITITGGTASLKYNFRNNYKYTA